MKANLAKVLAARAAELRVLHAKKARGEDVMTHVPTGLRRLDDRFGGLEIGILTLVVAHTGDGKTAVLGQFAKAAAQAGLGVLVILLEDPLARLADRYLAAVLGESANALARLKFDDPTRLDAALEHTDWARRVGVVAGQLAFDEALEVIDSCHEVGGAPLRLVLFDYAQGMEDTAEEKLAALGWALNARAADRALAAVLASQVTSEVIQRGRGRWERTLAQGRPDAGGFRPGKGDVAFSRRLEQRAKANIYVFREGRWRRDMGDRAAKDDRIELNWGKANFGPEGSEVFGWDGRSCTIYDLTEKELKA